MSCTWSSGGYPYKENHDDYLRAALGGMNKTACVSPAHKDTPSMTCWQDQIAQLQDINLSTGDRKQFFLFLCIQSSGVSGDACALMTPAPRLQRWGSTGRMPRLCPPSSHGTQRLPESHYLCWHLARKAFGLGEGSPRVEGKEEAGEDYRR